MSGGDPTKWDQVLEWNCIDALNRLCYVKDKQKEEEKQVKKMYGNR